MNTCTDIYYDLPKTANDHINRPKLLVSQYGAFGWEVQGPTKLLVNKSSFEL